MPPAAAALLWVYIPSNDNLKTWKNGRRERVPLDYLYSPEVIEQLKAADLVDEQCNTAKECHRFLDPASDDILALVLVQFDRLHDPASSAGKLCPLDKCQRTLELFWCRVRLRICDNDKYWLTGLSLFGCRQRVIRLQASVHASKLEFEIWNSYNEFHVADHLAHFANGPPCDGTRFGADSLTNIPKGFLTKILFSVLPAWCGAASWRSQHEGLTKEVPHNLELCFSRSRRPCRQR